MCVLGRPFGLRQMARLGKNTALVRDMTDTSAILRRPVLTRVLTRESIRVRCSEVERFAGVTQCTTRRCPRTSATSKATA